MKTRQLNAALTTLYFLIESGRRHLRKSTDASIREAFGMCYPAFVEFKLMHFAVDLKPNILGYLSQLLARIRWDDDFEAPFTRVRFHSMGRTLLTGLDYAHAVEISTLDLRR